jgi:dTDP-4-dehydrorhamnose reductase
MAGTDCVVLAAGLATPDAQWSAALVGANALLPGLTAVAARRVGAGRFLHLSSAAVRAEAGARESTAVAPFSAYSRLKALGEQVIASLVGPPTNTPRRHPRNSVQGLTDDDDCPAPSGSVSPVLGCPPR